MQPSQTLRKTPLHSIHIKYGAKMVNFSGWEMPIQYEGIRVEHIAVRSRAGLFDVSHMGRIDFRGDAALEAVEYLITNNVSKMKDGKVIYSLMCNRNGGIVDDTTVYRINPSHYFFCVNAANIEKDYEWIKRNKKGNVSVINLSDETSILALQGPKAKEVLQKLVNIDLEELKIFWFKTWKIGGMDVLISRTGYTGEDGFELYIKNEYAVKIWEMILEAGKGFGIKPIGLGARDTLRTEMKYTLYGSDIDDNVSPLEANLERYVDFGKKDFVGKKSLVKEKETGVKCSLVGFEMLEHSIPRHGFQIYKNGELIGTVTSGMRSWILNKDIGIGFVSREYNEIGSEFEIKIREDFYKAKVVETPFYKRK